MAETPEGFGNPLGEVPTAEDVLLVIASDFHYALAATMNWVPPYS
jgi:hypothetical protein